MNEGRARGLDFEFERGEQDDKFKLDERNEARLLLNPAGPQPNSTTVLSGAFAKEIAWLKDGIGPTF